MIDSIEYELTTWEEREVWLCKGECKQYRHRPKLKGQLPAICCETPAKFVMRYEEPKGVLVTEPIHPYAARL